MEFKNASIQCFYSIDLSLGKYATLSHTGRVDQLSTLPDGNNTFYYPSISLSSVLSDYVTLPSFVSFAKLRASFADVKGALTQSTIPSAFTAITGTSTNGGLLGYGSDLYSSYDGPSYTNQNAYTKNHENQSCKRAAITEFEFFD